MTERVIVKGTSWALWLGVGLGLCAGTFVVGRRYLRAPVVASAVPSSDEPAAVPAAPAEAPEALAPAAGAECEPGLIDDFEQQLGGRLPKCEGRDGNWYTYNDGVTGTQQVPAPGTIMPTEPAGAGAPGSAIHSFGTTAAGDFSDGRWGAGIGVDLSNPGVAAEKKPYDALARGYRGLRFRARMGDAQRVEPIVIVRFPDVNSDPVGGRCGKDCYHDYQIQLRLTTEWLTYTVLWSQLTIASDKGGAPFAADAITAIHWYYLPGTPFDLYLDDLEFVR